MFEGFILRTDSQLTSSSEIEFLLSTDPTEEGLSDSELMAPIPGPESQLHYSAQASYFAVFVEPGTRKLRKVVESRTKYLFDVKRILDSTTVLVLDSTPILLL